MYETLEVWDRKLFIYLNQLGTEQFDSFWIFATQIESWIWLYLIFLGIVLYFYRGTKGLLVVLSVVVTFGLTLLLTEFFKEFVDRLRPNNVHEISDSIRILQLPTTPSFFSGHASSGFAITTILVLLIRKYSKWIYLIFLWPLLFAYSRIYVGVHYPSDILVGTIVGILMGYLGFLASKRVVLT